MRELISRHTSSRIHTDKKGHVSLTTLMFVLRAGNNSSAVKVLSLTHEE